MNRILVCLVLSFGLLSVSEGRAASFLEKPIERAVKHMTAMQKKDGSFEYQLNYKTGRFSEDNNIVRQAGAGFGLAEYYAATKDKKAAAAIKKALQVYDKWSIGMENVKGAKLVKGTEKDKIRSGSTALALLAVLLYEETSKDGSFKALREAWKNGLIALHIPGQGIRVAPDTEAQSPYFDGETWLALAHYNRLFPEDKGVTEMLAAFESYLMTEYGGSHNNSFFHWGVMAASQRYKTTQDKRYLDFAVREYGFHMRSKDPDRLQCYALEGVGEIALALPKGDPIRKKMETSMKNSLKDFILPMQASSKKLSNGTPVEKGAIPYLGGFTGSRRKTETRIDNTQHCLSAMLKAQKIGSE